MVTDVYGGTGHAIVCRCSEISGGGVPEYAMVRVVTKALLIILAKWAMGSGGVPQYAMV